MCEVLWWLTLCTELCWALALCGLAIAGVATRAATGKTKASVAIRRLRVVVTAGCSGMTVLQGLTVAWVNSRGEESTLID